ncbi:hypothetical protein ACIPY6_41920 [Streptomyces sp. NPDC090054]|uniref:hypothetical protein n=1 Tax=Streptomyces sp. NPDC090054 TaxID=3365933 RepID=UPI00382F1BF2
MLSLRTTGTAAVDDPGIRRIVLDVIAVDFADSSMLNLMLLLLRSGRGLWHAARGTYRLQRLGGPP